MTSLSVVGNICKPSTWQAEEFEDALGYRDTLSLQTQLGSLEDETQELRALTAKILGPQFKSLAPTSRP